MKKRDLYYERIPTKLLREDIRLLGTFLGRVIKDQEGSAFFEIVEKFRLLSKNTLSDKNKSRIFSKISKEVKKLSPKNTFKLTRAFSHILNLMNLAESLDASRKLNEFENPYFKSKNQNFFIEDIIESLFKNKKIPDKKGICEYQKNKDPYLMIDCASEIIPGKSAKGYKGSALYSFEKSRRLINLFFFNRNSLIIIC